MVLFWDGFVAGIKGTGRENNIEQIYFRFKLMGHQKILIVYLEKLLYLYHLNRLGSTFQSNPVL